MIPPSLTTSTPASVAPSALGAKRAGGRLRSKLRTQPGPTVDAPMSRESPRCSAAQQTPFGLPARPRRVTAEQCALCHGGSLPALLAPESHGCLLRRRSLAKEIGMGIGRGWGWKIAVGALILRVALAGKVFSQNNPATQPAAPAAAPAPAPPPSKPDPAGTATGGIGDVAAKEAGKPSLLEIAEQAGKNKISINMMWTLLTGFLVMFMQAGFALVETGFTRAKNVAHTMMMNFMIYVIGMTGYWIMGYALQMGGVGALATLGGTGVLDSEFTVTLFGKEFGLFGMKGFFLARSSYDVAVFTLVLFPLVFMDTAAA